MTTLTTTIKNFTIAKARHFDFGKEDLERERSFEKVSKPTRLHSHVQIFCSPTKKCLAYQLELEHLRN